MGLFNYLQNINKPKVFELNNHGEMVYVLGMSKEIIDERLKANWQGGCYSFTGKVITYTQAKEEGYLGLDRKVRAIKSGDSDLEYISLTNPEPMGVSSLDVTMMGGGDFSYG